MHPGVTFLAPKNILHKDIANELGVQVIGRNTGHIWEQVDLPLYMSRKEKSPLLSLANTAPISYSNNYFTLHDLAFYHHPEWNSKAFATWYNVLIPRLAMGCRHMFTVSQSVRAGIIKTHGLPADKISVTYNGVPAHMLASGQPLSAEKEKIILSVGTFNRRKNHQNLVSAFLESDLKSRYQLALVGDRNKVFSESGLDEKMLAENNIMIYQHLSEEELASLYRRAELIVSLSLYEGFGIPLLEGLYNGCKVVCSDIPVYHEIYDGYAHFCDPLNIAAITTELTAATAQTERPDISKLLEKCSYKSAAKTILEQIKW